MSVDESLMCSFQVNCYICLYTPTTKLCHFLLNSHVSQLIFMSFCTVRNRNKYSAGELQNLQLHLTVSLSYLVKVRTADCFLQCVMSN